MNNQSRHITVTPMQSAIDAMIGEHHEFATVLRVLATLLEEVRKHEVAPDFTLFSAVLYYIDLFPDHFHHPTEDKFLFKLVRKRTHEVDVIIDALQAEHRQMIGLIRDLERALVHYQAAAQGGFEHFEALTNHYSKLVFEHMRIEENEILPVAELVLTAEDWTAIDEAFRLKQDPLFSAPPEHPFGKLQMRIAMLAPSKLRSRIMQPRGCYAASIFPRGKEDEVAKKVIKESLSGQRLKGTPR